MTFVKLAYPASNEISLLNAPQRAIKIARHSPCSICTSCSGLRPTHDVQLILDSRIAPVSPLLDIKHYGSDQDEDDADLQYIDTCVCGHDVVCHNADERRLSSEEFLRRTQLAVLLDEYLQEAGKFLDFTYDDEHITLHRKQLRSPDSLANPSPHTISSPARSSESSALSDPPQPPLKRRRISSSSLSEAEDDDEDDKDEDEDQPLAERLSCKTSNVEKTSFKRSQKAVPGSKSKSGRAMLPILEDQTQNMVDGVPGKGTKVKKEDTSGTRQLTRFATGTATDAARAPSTLSTKTEKAAAVEFRKGIIKVTPIENDHNPRSLVILTNLKTLFQKQLPNMPREYIARLVYDYNSRGLAIVKRGYKVVGGICYRPFPHRGFAEIVFFATASADQEKGYGGMLMDHFKSHIKSSYPEIMHFLTYADNYAVGYFEKQGFSKDITLDRSVWAAYIKDYEGGTIMQCTMLRKVDYLDKASTIAQQQEAVMRKIHRLSRSHVIYNGLPQFQDSAENIVVDPKDVPGLCDSGWSYISSQPKAVPKRGDSYYLQRILKKLQEHGSSWAFLEPVKAEEVADYYDVIKNPMDFRTMEHKLENRQYPNIEAFLADAQLIFDNCRRYNPESTIYFRNANKVESYLKDDLLKRTWSTL